MKFNRGTSMIVMLLVALCIALTTAATERKSCRSFGEDCGGCITAGCGWCASETGTSGFCLGASDPTSLCGSSKIFFDVESAKCPKTITPVSPAVNSVTNTWTVKQNNAACRLNSDCESCRAANCGWCVLPSGSAFCSANRASACVDPYSSDTQGTIAGECGVLPTDFSTVTLTVSNSASSLTQSGVSQDIARGMTAFGNQENENEIGNFDPGNIAMFSIMQAGTRDEDDAQVGERQSANTLVIFAFKGTSTLSSDQATDFFVELADNEDNRDLIQDMDVLAVSVASPSNSGTTAARGKDSDVEISGGALAGIIIGSLVFAAVLVILVVLIIYFIGRRSSYPLPFRSPAAAYRP